MYKSLHIISHPLVDSYMCVVRDKRTSFRQFREATDKLSVLIASECSKELTMKPEVLHTPLAKFRGDKISDKIILLPVLRAGLGLTEGFKFFFPDARIAHIGIYRDEEDLKPVKYYFRFPRLKTFRNIAVFILDPMLATGGSINSTISEIRKIGIRKIIIASLVCAPEGLKEIFNRYKNIPVYTCALDKYLNTRGFIVPGLGDAGDRMFGT